MKRLVLIANGKWAEFVHLEDGYFELVEKREHPQSKEKVFQLVSDRPGRTLNRVSAERHSLNEGQDVLEAERQKFARELTQFCKERYLAHPFQELWIVTGPKFLGELRTFLQHHAPLPYRLREIRKELSSADESLSEKMEKIQRWAYGEAVRKKSVKKVKIRSKP